VASIYQIHLSPAAQRQLKKLSASVQRLIFKQLDSLKHNPRPNGIKKLVGMDNLYRVRVGDYRIIYMIEDKKLSLLIVKVGDRKDVYRG
jgi:mRNA interferase RelE/StbE